MFVLSSLPFTSFVIHFNTFPYTYQFSLPLCVPLSLCMYSFIDKCSCASVIVWLQQRDAAGVKGIDGTLLYRFMHASQVCGVRTFALTLSSSPALC